MTLHPMKPLPFLPLTAILIALVLTASSLAQTLGNSVTATFFAEDVQMR